MRVRLALVGIVVTSVVQAADVPVAGERLELRAGRRAAARIARIVLHDPAIAPPFGDPSATAATLRLNGGLESGQCTVALALDAGGWKSRGKNGERRGYRSRRSAAATNGVRRVTIEPGRITIKAGGSAWPCDLSAAAREPVSIVVDLGDRRYCAGFGGSIHSDQPRHFSARDAPAPASCPSARVTVADLNVLHGLFCPTPTNFCRRPERVALLFDWIRSLGCPDLVTLQEIERQGAELVKAQLGSGCPFTYEAVYPANNGIDDEMILTRYPAALVEQTKLQNNYRTVLFARLDHPLGPVDVFSTHLSSSSDGAGIPCGATCPAECVQAGAANLRQCQAVQMARYVAQRHDARFPAILTGDFNEDPGSFVYRQFIDRGWSDLYLAAGKPECDPATSTGCTSGRADEDLSQMESPASNEVERIDYVFLVQPTAGRCGVDAGFTGIFAGAPNPFAPSCGPAPSPICWPSDHEGMQAAVDCP